MFTQIFVLSIFKLFGRLREAVTLRLSTDGNDENPMRPLIQSPAIIRAIATKVVITLNLHFIANLREGSYIFLTKQVCWNKDACEGRHEDRIAETLARFDCRLFVADRLQVYCRLFTSYFQVICSQGVIFRLFQFFLILTVSNPFPINFRGLKKKLHYRPTDRPTDQQSLIKRYVDESKTA